MNYKIIDPLTQIFSGTFVAFTVIKILPEHWNMFLGMLLGGALGMAVMFVAMVPLMAILGSFEVMIPMALVNMTVGMFSGMAVTGTRLPKSCIVGNSAILALLIYGIIWYSNRQMTKVK